MYKEELKKRLKKARIDSGYTQKQIEDILGIKQAAISQYENGKREPELEILATLIDFYEVPARWIIGTKN